MSMLTVYMRLSQNIFSHTYWTADISNWCFSVEYFALFTIYWPKPVVSLTSCNMPRLCFICCGVFLLCICMFMSIGVLRRKYHTIHLCFRILASLIEFTENVQLPPSRKYEGPIQSKKSGRISAWKWRNGNCWTWAFFQSWWCYSGGYKIWNNNWPEYGSFTDTR